MAQETSGVRMMTRADVLFLTRIARKPRIDAAGSLGFIRVIREIRGQKSATTEAHASEPNGFNPEDAGERR
ncbi:MAG TPA: hypothetical protein VK477_12220, partial [Acidobacteriota bacterium]|nr:hypothetical protein [Acidobacteriota bacterium]